MQVVLSPSRSPRRTEYLGGAYAHGVSSYPSQTTHYAAPVFTGREERIYGEPRIVGDPRIQPILASHIYNDSRSHVEYREVPPGETYYTGVVRIGEPRLVGSPKVLDHEPRYRSEYHPLSVVPRYNQMIRQPIHFSGELSARPMTSARPAVSDLGETYWRLLQFFYDLFHSSQISGE